MTVKIDRRVQRTRQLLRAALLSLIREKAFETISVQDIVHRANVGRATFYAHFSNKEDLLASGFDDLRASLDICRREALASGQPLEERILAFSFALFAHFFEHRDAFYKMVGTQTGALVQHLIHKVVLDLIRADLKAVTPCGDAGPACVEEVAQFLTGGLISLKLWWLMGNLHLSVHEINERFRQFAIPALKASGAMDCVPG